MNMNNKPNARSINRSLERLMDSQTMKDEIQNKIMEEFADETYAAGFTDEEIDQFAEAIVAQRQYSELAEYTAEKTVDKMYDLTDTRVLKNKLADFVVGVAAFAAGTYVVKKVSEMEWGSSKPHQDLGLLPDAAMHANSPFSDTSFTASPRPSGGMDNLISFDRRVS